MKTAPRATLFLAALLGALSVPCANIARQKSAQPVPCDPPGKSLVTVRVTVTDKKGRTVEGLRRDDFTILQKDDTEKIEYFCPTEKELSTAILLDMSRSMRWRNNGNALGYFKENILRFVEQIPPGGEYCIIAFGAGLEMVDWTNQSSVIKQSLDQFPATKGSTPLYDAIFAALEQLRKRTNPKKVLLLITDGIDNNSRHQFEETLKLLKESDVLVYAVDYLDAVEDALHSLPDFGKRILAQFSSTTGGIAYFPGSPRELAVSFDTVLAELRAQYLLGFRPTDAPDGKWRRIKVKVKPLAVRDPDKPNEGERLMDLKARTREGYYPK